MADFETRKDGVALIVKCPKIIDFNVVKKMPELIAGWTEHADLKLILLDFAETSELHPGACRCFAALQQTLRKSGGHLASYQLSFRIRDQIHGMGLDSVFGSVDTLEQAYQEAGIPAKAPGEASPASPPKVGLDVKFINPFLGAATQTFQIQANTQVQVGKPYLKKAGETFDPPIEIAGVLSLTSKVFEGTIALCFPAAVFLKVYENMVGEKLPAINEECEDAAGELLNMIFGQAKAELNDHGDYEIEKAIPAVIRGRELQIGGMTPRITIVIPVTTDFGQFHLEINLQS